MLNQSQLQLNLVIKHTIMTEFTHNSTVDNCNSVTSCARQWC